MSRTSCCAISARSRGSLFKDASMYRRLRTAGCPRSSAFFGCFGPDKPRFASARNILKGRDL